MTPSEFLASFRDIANDDEQTFANRTATWTEDPEFYLSLTKQILTIPANPDALEELYYFVSILRGMVSIDGRTLPALIFVAEAAAEDSEYELLGIHSLAGIRGFLLRDPSQHAHLVETFRRLARTPALEINATQCAIAITGEGYPQPPSKIYT